MSSHTWILEKYSGVENGKIRFRKVKVRLDSTSSTLKVVNVGTQSDSKSTLTINIEAQKNINVIEDYHGIFNPKMDDFHIIINNEHIFKCDSIMQKRDLIDCITANLSNMRSTVE